MKLQRNGNVDDKDTREKKKYNIHYETMTKRKL